MCLVLSFVQTKDVAIVRNGGFVLDQACCCCCFTCFVLLFAGPSSGTEIRFKRNRIDDNTREQDCSHFLVHTRLTDDVQRA